MIPGGGVMIGVTAATAKHRQTLFTEEEEGMAKYTQDDLSGDWEFKIVRSDSGAFRKPAVLSKLTEEEAQAGWEMLEKFDDSRIRFKRPRSARAKDPYRADGVDPYRTRYGVATTRYALVAGVLGLLVFFVLAVLVFFLMMNK